jgi:GT2 family glycosyltransferase
LASSMQPKVSIVIATLNGASELRKCLQSMSGLDYDNYEVVVVDNASTDDTCQMLRSEFPHVRLISLDRNAGRSEGLNIGSVASDGKYVMHLDNDVTFTDANLLNALVETMEADETVGSVGPIVLDQGIDRVQSIGGMVDLHKGTSSYKPWGGRTDYRSITEPVECDYVCGCAVLFRKSDLDRMGHYDQRYIIYWDDCYISAELKKLGLRNVAIPSATITHKVGGSGGVRSSFAYFQTIKNRVLFMRQFGRPNWVTLVLGILIQPWPGDSKKRRLKSWRIIYPSMLKALWWNLKDSLNGGKRILAATRKEDVGED